MSENSAHLRKTSSPVSEKNENKYSPLAGFGKRRALK
jgi:hypothetical protein